MIYIPSQEIQKALRALYGLDLLLGEYAITPGDLTLLRATWNKSWAIHQYLTQELTEVVKLSIDESIIGKEVNQMKKACKAKPMSMPKSAKAEMKEEKSEKKAIKKGKY